MTEWILQNSQWLFSGIGVVFLSLFVRSIVAFRKRHKRNANSSHNGGTVDQSVKIQTRGNMNVSTVSSAISNEYAEATNNVAPDPSLQFNVTIEAAHSGKSYTFQVRPNTTVAWLAAKAKDNLNLETDVELGSAVLDSLKIRWVLVDTRIKADWEKLDVEHKFDVHAVVGTTEGLKYSYNSYDHLEDLKIYSGIKFYLYAIPIKDSFDGPGIKASSAGEINLNDINLSVNSIR